MYVRIYVCMSLYVCMYSMYVRIYVCMTLYVCMYDITYVYMYACMYFKLENFIRLLHLQNYSMNISFCVNLIVYVQAFTKLKPHFIML